ncbi:MAG TPA: YhjD/YihY/BrkB family envelope integrity protein [Thermoanaerobaculia bacterium]|nr:YhjD/YihY/BrkB family envelope integrity protein [Thermoanaerobaculia bacterium]
MSGAVTRERASAAGASGRPSFPRQLAQYIALTLRQAHEDSVLLTASALAFVTVLSLIPLLAAFSYVGTRVFHQYNQRSMEIFVQVLPYSDETVVDKLHEFLEQAETLHGVGLLAFVATTLLAFATVEETMNRIWKVTRRRPLKVRMLSFAMLLFWAPLLIGATFSSLILLRQSPALRRLFQESFLLNVLPLALIVLGLTLLYWRVPYTTVRFRSALAGGLLAAILLEMLRQGFAAYVEFFRNVNAVYGSFAFALLFMLSIELTWAIVLLGSEAAYTAQSFGVLSRIDREHPPVQAGWVGLAALYLVTERFLRGAPVLTPEALAGRLHLPQHELERALHPLLNHDLLRRTRHGSYVLAADPRQIPVEKVFEAYDHRARRGVAPLDGSARIKLEELIGTVAEGRGERLEGLTLAELVLGLAAPRRDEYNTPSPASVGQ